MKSIKTILFSVTELILRPYSWPIIVFMSKDCECHIVYNWRFIKLANLDLLSFCCSIAIWISRSDTSLGCDIFCLEHTVWLIPSWTNISLTYCWGGINKTVRSWDKIDGLINCLEPISTAVSNYQIKKSIRNLGHSCSRTDLIICDIFVHATRIRSCIFPTRLTDSTDTDF